PLWRGGGTVFGPKPRSYGYKVSKKVRKSALKMALSSKLQEQTLRVLDRLELESPKTKRFAQVLEALDMPEALVVIDGKDSNIELSARNLSNAKVLRSEGLNVYDVLKFKNLVLVAPAIDRIEKRLLS
ncbi:MAG: 50S ribosomal protein L4, partial [Deltaproteobacteria bacterium]|nr:50S ribosomal protein L4 [Deltaproteobacteria bacterium]